MDACVNLINYNLINTFYNNFCWSYLGLDERGNKRKSFGATEANLCDTWRTLGPPLPVSVKQGINQAFDAETKVYRSSEQRRERFN